jgi:hypothetical protein
MYIYIYIRNNGNAGKPFDAGGIYKNGTRAGKCEQTLLGQLFLGQDIYVVTNNIYIYY